MSIASIRSVAWWVGLGAALGSGLPVSTADRLGMESKETAEILAISVPSPTDSDGDGLSDADEVALHQTDPRRADTDGDGQSDGDEVRAGTNPRLASSVFRITGSTALPDGRGQRITWSSVAGRTYTVQRRGIPGSAPSAAWVDVRTLTAPASSTTADDPAAPLSGAVYRVVLVESSDALRLSPPRLLVGGGLRLSWSSQPGASYRLERTPALAGAATVWTSVGTVVATGATTTLDDPAVLDARRFYRVTRLGGTDPLDRVAPLVSPIRASPVSILSEGIVTLSVDAEDNVGVAGVTFFDAGNLIGAASRVGAQEWRYLWPVTFDLNGPHTLTATAMDAAGNAQSSPPFTLQVQIGTAQQARTVGGVPVYADQFLTVGAVQVPTGNVRIGLATFAPTTSLSLNTATQTLAGQGAVTLPGLGVVFNGPFVIDPVTGVLSADLAFAGLLEPLALNSHVTLDPSEIHINLLTGAMSGMGEFILRFDGQPTTAKLHGAFTLNPATQIVTINSTATCLGVTGTGAITLSLADNTFELTGSVVVSGGENSSFTLNQAVFALRVAPGGYAFHLEGNPALPPLAALGLRLAGMMDLAGNLTLTGTATGALSAIRFTPVTVTMKRAGPAGVVTLTFAGAVQVPNLAATELAGGFKTDGSLQGVASQTNLLLGTGLNVRPRQDAQGRPLPVLTLLSSTNDQHRFRVNGEFLTVEASGVKPVEVEGPMILRSAGAGLLLESLELTNRLPIVDWPLPQNLKLGRMSLLLAYTNSEVTARMRGDLNIAREKPNTPVTIALDAGLAVNIDDPADLTLDTLLSVSALGVVDKVYLGAAKFHLLAGSKPVRGSLSLLDGSMGLFPKVPIVLPNATTNAVPATTGSSLLHSFALAQTTQTNTPPATNAPTIKREDFQLFVENVSASLQFVQDDFTALLTSGILRLPHIFTNLPAGLCPGQSSGASIALGTNSSLSIGFSALPEPSVTVRAEGLLNFTNIAVFPNFKGFGAEICTARLFFNPGGLPYLTNVQGAMQIPLPPGQTNKVALQNGAWNLLGFPSGTIALATDLKLYDGTNGVTVTLLKQGNTNCAVGSTFTVLPSDPFSVPPLRLTGGIEVKFPADMVTQVDGDTARAIACGTLDLNPDDPFRPRLELPRLAFGGNFHLGGSGGIVLSNALLSLDRVDNFFELGGTNTVDVGVTGTILVPGGPAFSLADAKFTFFDPERLPQFSVRSVGYSENQFAIAQKIPARVKAAQLTFKAPMAELPSLFYPSNVVIAFTAGVALPTEEKPVFRGEIKDMRVSFSPQGIPKMESIDGLTLEIGGMEIPPIEALGGKLHISGLKSTPATNTPPAQPALATRSLPGLPDLPDDPFNIFIAGAVEGSYNGYKLKVLLAFSPSGVAGLCIDFNAGNVGIPLDGYYLGGILLTGASGGVAFNRGDADPCDFTAWLDADGKPRQNVIGWPPFKISWEELQEKIESLAVKAEKFKKYLPGLATARQGSRVALQSFDPRAGFGSDALFDQNWSAGFQPASLVTPASSRLETGAPSPAEGDKGFNFVTAPNPQLAPLQSLASSLPRTRYTNEFGLPCPGDCPPPTVNIFCQPHPDQERFAKRLIFKFSSIDETTLNELGFTPQWVQARFAQGNDWATKLALEMANGVRNAIFSHLPLPDPQALGTAQARELLDIINAELAKMIAEFVPVIVDAIANQQNAQAVYEKIRDVAYEGAPCLDISLSVSGTLTHQYVSSFLSGTVGGSITSAGNAGLSGKINLFGVPVGKAKAFIAATDDQGDPNPSVCGEIDVSFGPLSLGAMRAAFSCAECATQSAQAFADLIQCLSDELVRTIVARVTTRITVSGKTRFQIAAELTVPERAAVMVDIYTGPGVTPDVRACFRQRIVDLSGQLNPEFLLCGEVRPRLFGLGMGPSFYSVGMEVNKEGFTGIGSFSPSFMMALPLIATASSTTGGTLYLAAGSLAATLFAQDQATYGYALRFPDPAALFLAGLDRDLGSPQALASYTDRQFDFLLENATYTFGYTLSPLGFKTVDAQMRVVLPNLTDHPARPGGTWVRPENRPLNPPLPSRLDLVLSALTNHLEGSSLGLLADPTWRGSAEDLPLALPPGPDRARVQGLSFAKDYFPHGGVIGGGYIQIPRALYEKPPSEFTIMIDPQQDALTRLSAAATYIQEYVLKSVQAGSLGFYVPAPNPPFFTDTQGQPLSRRVMMEAINNFDPSNLRVAQLYPSSEFFLKGYIDGKLLDVPIARGTLEAALADAQTGSNGLFRATADVPAGSWLDGFARGARLIFEMKGAPPAPIEVTFSNLLAQINLARSGTPTPVALQNALNTALDELNRSLPKIKLEADLPLTMPDPIDDVVVFNSATHLYAYSPRYEPSFQPGNTGPRARARREGGVAMQGRLDFKVNGATVASIPNAELAVTPQGNAPPVLAGQFNATSLNLPGVSLHNALINFASAPDPNFSASGSISPINFGVFSIQPLSGGTLGGQLSVARTGQNSTSAQLRINPAQLSVGSLLGGVTALRIHGATSNDPFTFATDAPWSATLSLEGTSPIDLQAGGEIALRIQRSNLQSATVSRDGAGVARVTLNLASGSSLIAFPGRAYQQLFTISSATSVTIGSDGKFTFDAAINDQTSGGVTLRGRVNVTNDPDVRLTLGGTVVLPALGGISIVPRVSGSSLEGGLVVQRTGGVMSAGLFVKPARVTYATVLGASQSFLIDGGATDQDFTFSTTAPWSARLTLDGATPLELRAGSFTVLRTERSNLSSMSLARDGAGVARIGMTVAGGSTLTAFPGQAFSQSVRMASSSTLAINSDNTFSLSSTLADAASFSDLSITGLAAGSSLNVTQNGFVMTGTVSGGALAQAPISGTVTGTVTITAGGVSLAGSVTVTTGPLVYDQFRIAPLVGGTITASLGNAGLAFPGGLRLSYRGAAMGAFDLPAFTIPANGDFNFTVGPVSVSVNGYGLTGANFTFRRLNGVTSVPSFSGTLSIPGAGASTVSVSGSLNSNGNFSLTGAIGGAVPLSGLVIGSLSSGGTAALTQTGLALTGTAAGGVLGLVSVSGSVTATVNVTSAGAMSLSGSASVTVNPIVYDQFRIAPASGTTFIATLNSTGLVIPSGLRLSYRGAAMGTFNLPTFTIPASGNYSFNVSGAGVTINGFALNSSGFTFQRSEGVVSVTGFGGTLVVPGPGATTLANVSVSGSLHSNGNFSLTGTAAGAITLSGLPIASLSSGATAMLNQSGLTLTGTVNGGVLSLVSVSGSVTGTVNVTSAGVLSVSGSVNVTVNPIVYDQFRIAPAVGVTFLATLNSTGLVIPSGLRLSYRGAAMGTFNLPTFTIPASGNYSFNVSGAGVTINGFALSSSAFTFQCSGGVVSVTGFGGSLSVPHSSGTLATVTVFGSLNSNGNFTLTGSTGANTSLTSSGVPVNSLNSGATTMFNQSSLTLQGTVTGGVLSQVTPTAGVTGLLTITSSGTTTLSGSLTIQPIVDDPFRIESSSGGNLGVTLNNSGLSVSGARLRADGVLSATVALPAFTIPASGDFTLALNPPNMSVAGIPCASISFTLRRQSGALSLNPFTANLNIPGFSQALTGSVNSAGSVVLDYSGSLTLGGFVASSGGLHLRNTGLSADGGFSLRFGATIFGTVNFSGNVTSGGSYSLARTSGGITIGGISIANPSLTLSASGATGSATLPYGAINVPLNSLSITSGSGLSFSQHDHNVNSGWIRFTDIPFTDVGDVYARAAGAVRFAASGGTTFTATLNYTWAGWIVGQTCNPPFPFGDGQCTTHFPPGNINDVSAPPRFSATGSIGTNGQFTVNTSFGGLSSFGFDFW